MRAHFRGMALAMMFPIGVWGVMWAQEPAPRPDKTDPPGGPVATSAESPTDAPRKAVEPKPITPSVKKGLDWLVEHQLKDGGWGQGDESKQMGGGLELRDKANVADTCVAALALIRSGSTPSEGPYRGAVARAIGFVRSQVESSDSQSLDVSTVKGTRVQMKLGPNIDTFLASLLLAEVNGKMADPAENKTVDVALHKVLDKIKKHQKADGTWDNATGWAPILAQSMAGKGLNRASQNGAKVADEVLAKAESYANAQFALSNAPKAGFPADRSATGPVSADSFPAEPATRSPSVAFAADGSAKAAAPVARVFARGGSVSASGRAAGMGSAGVELYDRAASLSVLQDSVNTNATKESELKRVIATSPDASLVSGARNQLARFKMTEVACAEARDQVVARLDDKGFIAGFGSNGGEEFLSYMNIAESLVLQGGPAWKKWDEAMTANLGRVQNDDGSWTGHHCITGRTFCTSTALLVLLSDRAPVPNQARSRPAVQ